MRSRWDHNVLNNPSLRQDRGTGDQHPILCNGFVRKRGCFLDPAPHQRDAIGVIGHNHLAWDADLDDHAGTHHARGWQGIRRHVLAGLLPPGLAQGVHLTMGNRIALLDTLVAPLTGQRGRVGSN